MSPHAETVFGYREPPLPARCPFCGMTVVVRRRSRLRGVPRHRGAKPKGSSERVFEERFADHVDPETRKRCKGSNRIVSEVAS